MKLVKACIISLLFIFFTAAVATAGRIDPFELAKRHGFKNIDMFESFKNSLPTNPWSDTDKLKFKDEELFKRVKNLYEEVKDLKMEDFHRPALGSSQMASALVSFKGKAEFYFEDREKALAMYGKNGKEEQRRTQDQIQPKKQLAKIDPAEFIKGWGFRDYTHLEEVRKAIPTDSVSSYNHDWWRNEKAYQSIKKLYEAVKDLKKENFGRCADGIMIGAQSIEELMKFKDKARVYLANRDEALKRYSEAQQRLEAEHRKELLAKVERRKKREEAEAKRLEQEAREEEERERQGKLAEEKERREAPQQVVAQFRNSPKPINFEQIKKTVSRFNDWKVAVFKVAKEWEVLRVTSDQWIDKVHSSRSIIFTDLPMDASSYRSKDLLIKASIDRPFEKDYLITDYAGNEAVAVIPKKVLKQSGIAFKQAAFIGCRLVDILSVRTVGGTTKPISKVKVTYLFSSDEYDAFVNYVVGHPEEFPQNKYIVIRFD